MNLTGLNNKKYENHPARVYGPARPPTTPVLNSSAVYGPIGLNPIQNLLELTQVVLRYE
jgi:hypothetical protein